MSDPHSRLGEARKQIRLAAEELESTSSVEELDQDVLEDLQEAARIVESVQDEIVDREDDPLTGA